MAFLGDHPDFPALVRIVAERLQLLPVLVLKDYWATRVLRAIAADAQLEGQVIFKGGTSLSKGWKVIERFSEDVDLLLTGPAFGDVPTGGGARERLLKRVRAAVEAATPLRLPSKENMTPEEFSFFYFRGPYHGHLRYPIPTAEGERSDAFNTVLVEMGFRGGSHPHVSLPLNSLVAEHLGEFPLDDPAALNGYEEDLTPFAMELLDPSRTLVEKLLAIHVALVGNDLDRFSPRHLYDVAQLFEKLPAVETFVRGPELPGLLHAAIDVSNRFYDAQLNPETFDLRRSPVFTLNDVQAARLRARFESERGLYFGHPPTFDGLLASLARLRAALGEETPATTRNERGT